MTLETVKKLIKSIPNAERQIEQEDAVIELCHAAMWAALGEQTQLSRSAFSIVFIPELRAGRADLSDDPVRAIAQLEHAGLDVQRVTQIQLDGYRAWRNSTNAARSVNDARILITRKFPRFVRMSAGLEVHEPHVRVSLIDGLGQTIGEDCIRCRDQWEPETRNLIGGLGAMCSYPDYDAINRFIDRLRRDHPRYANATVIDNNQKG